MGIADFMDTRGHFVDVEVPPVKWWGITIQEAYTITTFVDCEHGETCRERMRDRLIKSVFEPNPVWQSLTKEER